MWPTLGITGSRQLLTSDGRSLPLLPLTAADINNGSSDDNGRMILDLTEDPNPYNHSLGEQLRACMDLRQPVLLFWVGAGNTQVIPGAINPHGWTENDYTRRLADDDYLSYEAS